MSQIMPIFDAGNTLQTARADFSINSTTKLFSDHIGGFLPSGSLDTRDYYRFTLSSSSALGIALQGNNAKLELLNSSGNVIEDRSKRGTSEDYISSVLASGTYYIRVTPENRFNKTNYQLSVGGGSATDQAGNTFSTAYNIGVLDTTSTTSNGLPSTPVSTFHDQVGIADRSDFYRFTLDTTSILNLSLSGLGNTLGALLYREGSHTPIGKHLSGMGSSLPTELDPGTYYLQIVPSQDFRSDSTSYTLSLSAILANLAGQGDGGPGPRSITVGATPVTFREVVSFIDGADVYQFHLGPNSSLNASLTNQSGHETFAIFKDFGGADIELWGPNGLVAKSTALEYADEAINVSGLPEGNYSLIVEGTPYIPFPIRAAGGFYTLKLSSSTPSNLLPSEFQVLGSPRSGAEDQTFTGHIGKSNTVDTYRIEFGAPTPSYLHNDLRVSLSGLSGNVDVRVIRDINQNGVIDLGEVIATSSHRGNASETIDLQGLAFGDATFGGNYFVQVYQAGCANTNYTLRLQTASFPAGGVPEPNNSLRSAYNLQTLNGGRNFASELGNGNRNDFYQFRLDTVSNFGLYLVEGIMGGLTNANAELIRDANHNGKVDPGEVIAQATLANNVKSISSTGLAAGEYFVRIYSNGAKAPYLVVLNATPGLGVAAEPNNSRSNAYNLGSLNGKRYLEGFVGINDTQDFYKFHLDAKSYLNLSLTGLAGDADVEVYKGQTLIASSKQGLRDSDRTPESINRPLEAGDYYVRVVRYGIDTDYRLNLDALAIAGSADCLHHH